MPRHAIATFLFAAACAFSQEGPFAKGLYPVLEKADCHNCHRSNGVASPTRLHFPDSGAPAAQIEAFGRSLVMFVNREKPESSLLLTKPTNRMAHAGGERIKKASADEAAIRQWIAELSKLSGPDLAKALRYREEQAQGRGHATPRIELRRLTHSQYNNTVRDLLGDQTSPANQFPPEDFVNGFRNQSQAQNLSPLLIEAYSAAAEKLARNAFRGGDTKGLVPCKEATPACRSRFVGEFGMKAFRRPLEPAERKRYEAMMATEAGLVQGAQLVVEAMLQSTSFLFRLDETSDPKWKPYVTATRLSYALWDTTPDSELYAAAARGDLNSPQGVERASRRLLDHPRAKESLNEFTSQWMRFDRILTAARDRRKYPRFTRETAAAMTEEAKLFIGDLVWNDRNFMDLYTADYGFPNADLAWVYGVDPPAKEFDRVRFPKGSERAGLLGQALFLAITSKPEDSALTARGLFIREQFLCQQVPDPPAGVNTNLPPVTKARPQTNRDRMSEHATNPGCATCHKLIDPIGFGFERFDAVGSRREKFQLQFAAQRKSEAGSRRGALETIDLDIDSKGFVAGLPGSDFSSPAELGSVMAKSQECQECVVKQYFRYTSGRTETPADRPMLRKVFNEFRDSQFKFKQMIVALMRERAISDSGGTVHVASHHPAR